MSLKTHSVYKEVQTEGRFFIGRLYDGKGNKKFEIIKADKEEMNSILEEEFEKYALEGDE